MDFKESNLLRLSICVWMNTIPINEDRGKWQLLIISYGIDEVPMIIGCPNTTNSSNDLGRTRDDEAGENENAPMIQKPNQ